MVGGGGWVVYGSSESRSGLDAVAAPGKAPPTGFVVGIYARTDMERAVHKTPVGRGRDTHEPRVGVRDGPTLPHVPRAIDLSSHLVGGLRAQRRPRLARNWAQLSPSGMLMPAAIPKN